jgi:hypothetical protein
MYSPTSETNSEQIYSPADFHGACMLKLNKLSFLLLLPAVAALAETHITGDITGMTFESGGNPYIVEQDVLIPAGSKAIIKEGCVFLFKPFTGLTVHGHLIIDGTQEHQVVFTSINDGEYNTASEQLPNPFDWNGILVTRESGTVSMKHFALRFSVYGIKSQNSNIQLENGLFRQNGQFHFTINDQIQFVQDNIAYSFAGSSDPAAPKEKPKVAGNPTTAKPKKITSTGVKIFRFTSLGFGLAGGALGATFGIKTAIDKAAWDAKADTKPVPDDYDYNKEEKKFFDNLTWTIVGSSVGILGLTGFGISFLF